MAGWKIMPRSIDLSVPEMNDPVHDPRLIHEGVVAGNQDGFFVLLEPAQDFHQLQGEFGVQMGRGFVGDNDRRVIDQGPGNGHSLGFAARKPFDFGLRLLGDVEKVEKVQSPLLQNRMPFSAGVGRQHHVFQGGDSLDEVKLLEDEPKGFSADLGEKSFRQAGDLPADEEDPPGGGPGHAADEAEEGGLPRTAGPFEDRDLLRFDRQAHSLDSRKFVGLALVEDFADVLEFNHGFHVLITESGSIVAALQEGMIVATV